MRRAVVFVCGFLIAVAAIPHALLGWPGAAEDLRKLSASEDVVRGLAIGWWFGSASFVAMGIAVLLAWRELPANPRAWQIAFAIGAVLAVFGAGALAYSGGNPHFLGFLGLGAILAVAAWRARGELPAERRNP
jgi:hypothetical protein